MAQYNSGFQAETFQTQSSNEKQQTTTVQRQYEVNQQYETNAQHNGAYGYQYDTQSSQRQYGLNYGAQGDQQGVEIDLGSRYGTQGRQELQVDNGSRYGTQGRQEMQVDLGSRYGTQERQMVEVDLGSRYGTQGRHEVNDIRTTTVTQQQQGGGAYYNDRRYDTADAAFDYRSHQPSNGFAGQANRGLVIENKQQFLARRQNTDGYNYQLDLAMTEWKPTPKVEAVFAKKQRAGLEDDTIPEFMYTTEDEYRRWLTEHFKRRFDPHEHIGGMPIEEFGELARKADPHRSKNLTELFKKLDKDGNNRVSWNEFFNGMKYTKKEEVPKCKRLFNSFVKGMTPAAKKKITKEKREAEEVGEPIPEETYLQAYNCRPPPIFIPVFYIACWIFFIIYAVELQKGPEWNRVGWEKGFPFESPLVFCPSLREQAWRFLSYSLLHDGYHHILFNTAVSLLLGLPLETVHKCWRVAPVFIIGILMGSFASSLIDSQTMLIGASGGVYSLIGAHYALIVMNWEELQDDWTNIRVNPLRFLLSGVMRLVYLTLLVALDFGLAFYRRYSGTETLPTSAVAHIGGLLAGLCSGVPILRNIDKKPWEGYVAIVGGVITVILILFGVFWNIFYQGFPADNSIACSNPSLLSSVTGK